MISPVYTFTRPLHRETETLLEEAHLTSLDLGHTQSETLAISGL
jgi:hypothetical protein